MLFKTRFKVGTWSRCDVLDARHLLAEPRVCMHVLHAVVCGRRAAAQRGAMRETRCGPLGRGGVVEIAAADVRAARIDNDRRLLGVGGNGRHRC